MRTREQILAYLKEYRTLHAERISQQKKDWYKKHILSERQKRKDNYQKNRQDNINKAVKWGKDNPEKRTASRRKWATKNRHKTSVYGSNYRARKRNTEHESYDRLEVFRLKGEYCYLCGENICLNISFPHPFSLSIDHIVPVSRGGSDTIMNVAPTHLSCNIRKGDKLL